MDMHTAGSVFIKPITQCTEQSRSNYLDASECVCNFVHSDPFISLSPAVGRNYGYAKYANKESAMKAIQTLHGQNLSGQRIKVLEAEPPKGGDDGPTKKQKV